MSSFEYIEILRIYNASDGRATRGLYERLERLGPIGFIAVNLFRAQKNSSRAKVYRGGTREEGSYRGLAYRRKQWAMDNLAQSLQEHAAALGIRWGWKVDPVQTFHNNVLYIDLPTGQVSFHTDQRGQGPDYPGDWDRMRNASDGRICLFVAQILESVQRGELRA